MVRRSMLRLIPLVGLVLLAGWLGETVHHHPHGGLDHSCVVCSAGHVPAVSVTSSVPAPPRPTIVRVVVLAFERAPLEGAGRVLGARAPPIG